MTGKGRGRALVRSRPVRFVLWRLRPQGRACMFFAAVACGWLYGAVEEASAGNWGPLALWLLGVGPFLLWFCWPALAGLRKHRKSTGAHSCRRLWF